MLASSSFSLFLDTLPPPTDNQHNNVKVAVHHDLVYVHDIYKDWNHL